MLHAVIMAGGSGTRLWPASRVDCPKQLLNLQGDRTMIQATVDRLGDLVSPDRVFIATTERLRKKIHEQLTQLPPESLLCEPCPRNTAPCIGLAAVHLLRHDPEATMAVMPADHVIGPTDAFRRALRFGQALVEERPERLVTFGIRPTYPSVSFGYIEADGPLASEAADSFDNAPAALEVKNFREKPEAEVARQYMASGSFYWNAGIFLWKARTVMDALARFEPEMAEHLKRIGAAVGSPDYDEVLQREFAAIEGISIDYAVMERADEVVVIDAPYQWDDVGGWRALERLRPTDSNGNTIAADRHIEIDSTGTIARVGDPNHTLALIGVKDLIVIVTPDATLVADKNDEAGIRKVVDELKRRGWEEYL